MFLPPSTSTNVHTSRLPPLAASQLHFNATTNNPSTIAPITGATIANSNVTNKSNMPPSANQLQQPSLSLPLPVSTLPLQSQPQATVLGTTAAAAFVGAASSKRTSNTTNPAEATLTSTTPQQLAPGAPRPKRGRRKKRPDLSDDERRALRAAQNRLATRRSRERTRLRAALLREQLTRSMRQNEALQQERDHLIRRMLTNTNTTKPTGTAINSDAKTKGTSAPTTNGTGSSSGSGSSALTNSNFGAPSSVTATRREAGARTTNEKMNMSFNATKGTRGKGSEGSVGQTRTMSALAPVMTQPAPRGGYGRASAATTMGSTAAMNGGFIAQAPIFAPASRIQVTQYGAAVAPRELMSRYRSDYARKVMQPVSAAPRGFQPAVMPMRAPLHNTFGTGVAVQHHHRGGVMPSPSALVKAFGVTAAQQHQQKLGKRTLYQHQQQQLKESQQNTQRKKTIVEHALNTGADSKKNPGSNGICPDSVRKGAAKNGTEKDTPAADAGDDSTDEERDLSELETETESVGVYSPQSAGSSTATLSGMGTSQSGAVSPQTRSSSSTPPRRANPMSLRMILNDDSGASGSMSPARGKRCTTAGGNNVGEYHTSPVSASAAARS